MHDIDNLTEKQCRFTCRGVVELAVREAWDSRLSNLARRRKRQITKFLQHYRAYTDDHETACIPVGKRFLTRFLKSE